jgi:hypothetical protein
MDVEIDLPTKRVNGRMWQPGQSGNPLGFFSLSKDDIADGLHSNQAGWRRPQPPELPEIARKAESALKDPA